MQNSIQKKNKKILFLIDIKNRDLPSSALIAYHLMKMKYKVYFQSVLNPQNNFGFHKKTFDAVIFPKFNNNGDRFIYSYLQAKKNNKLIICIENEGNQNYLNKKKFLFHPDVYFFWGNQQKKKYNFKKNIRKVLGSPKMDFFHKKFRKITSTKAIKNKLGIKNKTKIITFMTRTQEAHREINQIKAISKRRKKMYLEPPHLFLDFYKATRKILKKNIYLVDQISKKYLNYKIIIKPHPNENFKFWEKKFSKNKNIIIAKDTFTHELLRITDFNITNNLCNTTLESLILGVPCLELQENFSTKYSSKDHYNLPFLRAKTLKHSMKLIDQTIKNKKKYFQIVNNSKKIQNYIKKFFFKFDGLRSLDYAKNIDRCIKSHIVLKKLSNKEENLKDSLEKKFKTVTNNKTNYFKNLLDFIRNKEYDNRGRYDHRYKKDDEIFWYKKFEKINL